MKSGKLQDLLAKAADAGSSSNRVKDSGYGDEKEQPEESKVSVQVSHSPRGTKQHRPRGFGALPSPTRPAAAQPRLSSGEAGKLRDETRSLMGIIKLKSNYAGFDAERRTLYYRDLQPWGGVFHIGNSTEVVFANEEEPVKGQPKVTLRKTLYGRYVAVLRVRGGINRALRY